MGDRMADFKHLIDTAKPGVMDELCKRYAGFYRYAKVLETIAGAIQSGAIKVPGERKRESLPACGGSSSAADF